MSRYRQFALAYSSHLRGALEMAAIAYARSVVELEEEPIAPDTPEEPGEGAPAVDWEVYNDAMEATAEERDAYEEDLATYQARQHVADVIRGRAHGNKNEVLRMWMLEAAMDVDLLKDAVSASGEIDPTKFTDSILDTIVRDNWEEAYGVLADSYTMMGDNGPIG